MLNHLGWQEAARLIQRGLQAAIHDRRVTYDLARQIDGAHEVGCMAFGEEIVRQMQAL